ncbi:MAG: FHA domain-containing protein [Gammaproteobacteria bacterium]
MHNNKNDSPGNYQVDDSATGEYPVLLDNAREPTDFLPALNGVPQDVTVEHPQLHLPAGGETQVSGWLADLEAEIARLHDRWQQVENGFGAKDGLIAELKTEITSRDDAVAELRTRLERNAEVLTTLERSLAEKNNDVANLSAELARRAATHEQSVASLATVTAERQVAQRDLEAARVEIVRLNNAVEREQAAVKALAARGEQLLAAQAAMTLRVQELETYIDGRAQSWSGLKTEITEQKNTILRLEKGLKTKDVSIDDGARTKRELEQKLVDLERQNSEISGRRKEREAAYDELQRKLTEHFAAAEQLKADLAKRIADHDRLLASATTDRTLIGTLEAAVREKDSALTALEARLAVDRSSADERLRALEQDLAQRDAALAQSHELAQRQSQLATDLKTELDVKRTSVDMLQRSVHRISNLGASLAELERRIQSSNTARPSNEVAVPVVNAIPEAEPAELLPLQSFLSLDGSSPAVSDTAAKLVGSVGGEKMSFPLSKGEMTIGRGKTSDIRISSHFISRVHAKIVTRGIATMIEDIGSKNGIFVNANRVKRCVLRDGDVVSLASELELKFVDAAH